MKKFIILCCFLLPMAVHADNILDNTFFTTDITLENGPYVIVTNLTIPSGITVMVEPGTIIKFATGGGASLTVNGVLDAEGEGAPIIFTSLQDDLAGGDTNLDGTSTSPRTGDWAGINVTNTGSFTCDNCTIRYAGYNSSAGVTNNGGLVNIAESSFDSNGNIGFLTNGTSTISQSSVGNDVIGVDQTGGALVVSDSSIIDNSQEGLIASGNSLALTDNSFSGNGKTALISEPINFLHEENISSDIAERGFSMAGTFPDGYHLNSVDLPVIISEGQPVVSASTTVYVDPGTVIKLGDSFGGGSMVVFGTLIADGTLDDKINFTSLKDDSVGGDTNGDGSASTPSPQNWFGLLFEPGSTETFANSVIKYSGNLANGTYIPGVGAAIYERGGNLTMDHSLLENNFGTAIFSDNGSSTITNTEFTNNNEGLQSRGGTFSLSGDSFHGMSDQAVYNQTGTPISGWPDTVVQTIDARNNWWGSASGPDDLGTSTPTGTGERVSDHVLYDPWLTTDPFIVSTSTPDNNNSTSTPDNTGSSTPPTSTSTPARIPVIIVPGIVGSYLVRDSDNEEVWPNITKMLLPGSDSYLDDLMFDVSGVASAPIDAPSVIKILPGLDSFQGLFDELFSSGLTENQDLFEFPYDWRLDISQTALDLKQKIDQVEAQTGSNKVDLVAHSMGGLVVKEYLKDYGGNNVDIFVDIATPHTGAPEAFKILNYGDDLDIRPLGVSVLSEAEMKKVSQNMPAVYELLPSENYFDDSDKDYKFYVFNGVGTNQNLTFQQTQDYMDAGGRNQTLVDRGKAFHEEVDGLDPVSTYGVKTYNIVGCGMPTIGQFFILGQKPDGTFDYDIKMINGDGTVPLKSAEAIHALHTYYVKDGEHATLPSTNGVKELVASLLKGDNPNISSYPNLSSTATGCTIPNGKIVSFHSPITLNVYDASGNHAGPDANGDIEDHILGADYETIEDNKFVFLPDGQDYQVTGQATGVGKFDARVETLVDGEVATTTVFQDIPINSNSQTQFSVGASVPSTIALDENGDGTFESSVSASSVSGGLDESADQTPSIISGPNNPVFQSYGSANNISARQASVNVSVSKPVKKISPKIINKNLSLATTSKTITKRYQNTATAYQSLSGSVKNVFISLWSWF